MARIFFLAGMFAMAQAKIFAQLNIAQGKTVVVSSVYDESPQNAAVNAVDGNGKTMWLSKFSAGQWLYVDFGSTHKINEVVVNWGAGTANTHALNFALQVSSDAVNWKTVDSVSANKLRTNSFKNLSETGRYIRVKCAGRSGSTGYAIRELEILGEPSGS